MLTGAVCPELFSSESWLLLRTLLITLLVVASSAIGRVGFTSLRLITSAVELGSWGSSSLGFWYSHWSRVAFPPLTECNLIHTSVSAQLALVSSAPSDLKASYSVPILYCWEEQVFALIGCSYTIVLFWFPILTGLRTSLFMWVYSSLKKACRWDGDIILITLFWLSSYWLTFAWLPLT